MKKGFTIVELAIVLVVIGIILAMAVKGKALVETARYKAEINKIRKLEAAVHIWLATHPDYVPISDHGNWGDTMMQYFYKEGILAEKELESIAFESLGPSGGYGSGKPGKWMPVFCQYWGDGLATYASIDSIEGSAKFPGQDFRGTNYCAQLFVEVEPNPSTAWVVNMPRRLQCMTEVFMDDQSVTNGIARYDVLYDAQEFTGDEYRNCMALSMVESSNSNMSIVLY